MSTRARRVLTPEEERELWAKFDTAVTKMDKAMTAMNDVFKAAFPRG